MAIVLLFLSLFTFTPLAAISLLGTTDSIYSTFQRSALIKLTNSSFHLTLPFDVAISVAPNWVQKT